MGTDAIGLMLKSALSAPLLRSFLLFRWEAETLWSWSL